MECLPLLCPPTGPDTPFGSPLLIALDAVRVIVWGLCLFIIGRALTTVYLIRNTRQRAIYIALACGAFAIIGTEIDHLGDYAHYRLALHAGAALAGAYGLRGIQWRVRDWDDHDSGGHRR